MPDGRAVGKPVGNPVDRPGIQDGWVGVWTESKSRRLALCVYVSEEVEEGTGEHGRRLRMRDWTGLD